MIKTIAHLADIHIRKTPNRNEEYKTVFQNLINSLKEKKPDIIVIAGDLVHDYLDLQGEQLIMANNLLNELSKIAPVRITRGNHDCRKKSLKRVDSVKAIVQTLNNPRVIYYDNTNFWLEDNVVWAIWHHGEPKNNPWKTKEAKKVNELLKTNPELVTIDLFHDPVNGCKSTTNFEMNSKSYYKISDFKGDFSFFGDIHKMQFLDKKKTKAYCGSLIAQDISEGDDNFHGYLLWDIENKTCEEVPIENEYSFKNVRITPYTDFNDLDFEIPNPTKYMKIRFLWGTLPHARTKENERKVVEYVKGFLFKEHVLTFVHKNEFIENKKVDVSEEITLNNILEQSVQHDIFKEYLKKIGADEQLINDVIALDEEIVKDLKIDDNNGIEWNIIKFGATNFMSYRDLEIDWRNMDGLFQITGINTAGKTTIMKLISYVLFGKAIETEKVQKFGDRRFVNNRNGATFCEGYLVIEANGEYYGIKKRTEINRNRAGDITGSPTSMSYYALASPDDVMDDESAIEKLDEDRRIQTQKKLNAIVGSYDNFNRIVMTTSDTLNKILSSDMADFIDSLLFDSGLDIFDKKLEGFKAYQKKVNDKPRVFCNVEATELQNATLTQETATLQTEIMDIESLHLPELQVRIQKGKEYQETLTKKLFKIDPEIYNLDVEQTKEDISTHDEEIKSLNARKTVLENAIKPLKETYDSERLDLLLKKKDFHKTAEYQKKVNIKSIEQAIREEDHAIALINGDIKRYKEDGGKLKQEIIDLKNSKVCSQCGQDINKPEHVEHINKTVKSKEVEMFAIVEKIKAKENDKKPHNELIDTKKTEIETINADIQKANLEMESVLTEIGTLTNDKNDVEKRKELQTELDQIPTKVQNEELKKSILQQKIDNHENSLKQIEENRKIEKGIEAAKAKIKELEDQEKDLNEDILIKKNSIAEKQTKILTNKTLIEDFKAQEYQDMIRNTYKECVHRDGIPRQMLINFILPKINLTLENILSSSAFKVWLDADDLRPKLVYNSRPNAVIDCISASGKERTFSSVILKFALNQINVKSKPSIFLLDEVMGKLDEEGSVEEFINILQIIKANMKKMLVIEHKYEINPDYLISVQLDDDGISSLTIE